MYKVIISQTVRKKISSFTEAYLQTFLDLFSDSWITNVSLIENNYRDAASNLKQDILSAIDSTFTEEVLPKRVSENGELCLIVAVWNFRLFIDYTEDAQEEIRYIEHIEFYKK